MTQAENLIREGLRARMYTKSEPKKGKGTTQQRRAQWKPEEKVRLPQNPQAFPRAGVWSATSEEGDRARKFLWLFDPL